MANAYAALCDEFYINMRLGTLMKLATDRATIVSFFERMQRLYPELVNFRQDGRHSESSIEENHTNNSYRWMSLEPQRLSSGYFNAPDTQEAYKFNRSVLETVPNYLAVSPIDLDYLDVLWGFDFSFKGNHHELISETLLAENPLGRLLEFPGSHGLNFEISSTISLSEDARTHARIWVEPRTSLSQIRSGEFAEEMLSLYVIIRQTSGGKKLPDLHDLHSQLIELGEKFIADFVLTGFIMPIREGIARRS
jgi:hypothetical protein